MELKQKQFTDIQSPEIQTSTGLPEVYLITFFFLKSHKPIVVCNSDIHFHNNHLQSMVKRLSADLQILRKNSIQLFEDAVPPKSHKHIT